MNKLNELEKLAKSSYSQSTVHVEIGELLDLIEIARAAKFVLKYVEPDEDYKRLKDALAELECGE
jgi:hypothetical protein